MPQSTTTFPYGIGRNMRGEIEAQTDVELQRIDANKTRIARVTTMRRSRGGVHCTVTVGVHEKGRAGGFSGFTVAIGVAGGGDYHANLAGEQTRATENAIRRVHLAGLATLPGHLDAIRLRYGIGPKPSERAEQLASEAQLAAEHAAELAFESRAS